MKTIVMLISLFILPVCAFGQTLPTLAVVDFNTTNSRYHFLGRQSAELISDAVVNAGLFDVMEREKLASILKEQSFSGSGMVAPASAIEMGAMLGAQYLMTGKIISADVSTKSFSGYNVRTTKTTCTLKISVKVLDTKTGRVVFSGKESASSSSQSTNNLHVKDGGNFVGLAETISRRIADRMAHSGRFIPVEKESTKMVNVMFTSQPEAADVEIDGVFYGNAGQGLSVPSGMHAVKISMPGYEIWEKKAMLRDGLKIRATLSEAADLKITQKIE